MATVTFDPFNEVDCKNVMGLMKSIWEAPATQPVAQPAGHPMQPQVQQPMQPPQAQVPTGPPQAQQPSAASGVDVSDKALQDLAQRVVQAQLPGVSVQSLISILTNMGVATIGQLPQEKRIEFYNNVVALSGGLIK